MVVLETFVAPGLVSLVKANTSADMDHNGLGRQMVARMAECLTLFDPRRHKDGLHYTRVPPPIKNDL